MEIQGTQNYQNNLDKEKQSWKIHTSLLQNILDSCSYHNSVVLHNDRYIDLWNRIESP